MLGFKMLFKESVLGELNVSDFGLIYLMII